MLKPYYHLNYNEDTGVKDLVEYFIIEQANSKPVYLTINEKTGTKYYYQNRRFRKFHREDGPAIEWGVGAWNNEEYAALHSKEWYLNGVKLSEEEFNKRMIMKYQEVIKELTGNSL